MTDNISSPLCDAPAFQYTPLDRLHRKCDARMAVFAGYEMPLNYSNGIVAEHLHTRADAGLFDVSNMGQAFLEGPNAARQLESLVPGDIQSLVPGRARYTQILDCNGYILDELILTRLEDRGSCERFFVVVNAETMARDFSLLGSNLPGLALTILSDHALIALQGPKAAKILARHLPDVAAMPFMSSRHGRFNGRDLVISRSGYTGEDGFEISIAAEDAEGVAEVPLAEPEVWPIGLCARDSLRLEAGLCRYGYDIDATTNPIEAGLGWSISKRRMLEGGFPGEEPLRRALKNGCVRKRIGLLLDGRMLAREGAHVTTTAGEIVGHVTSGCFSPSLGRPIAMGYVVAKQANPGTTLHIFVRGKLISATVTPMPFVPHRHYGRP